MLRVVDHVPAARANGVPFDLLILEHDARRLRRKVLPLLHGGDILVDFPQTVTLGDRDRLVLEDGRNVEIIAAEEQLYEVRASSALHLVRLAWHLGNRHLSAQLDADRILIRRDPVIRTMLLGLGADVSEISEPFAPEHGAYHGHGHSDDHALLRK